MNAPTPKVEQTATFADRLRRQRYEREDEGRNGYIVIVPCDADDWGAQAVPVNPDGEAAATLIDTLTMALLAAMPLLGLAESNASGNPEFDYVGPIVANCRAALAKVGEA